MKIRFSSSGARATAHTTALTKSKCFVRFGLRPFANFPPINASVFGSHFVADS